MKLYWAFAFLSLVLTPSAQAAATTACNATVDITDTDPRGTNLRATPGGAIIAALRNTSADGWIEVHLTGEAGDWLEIDNARLIDPGNDDKAVFAGKGFLHKSVLGVSGFENGFPIYAAPDVKSRVIDPAAAGDQTVDFLGCAGDFLKVHVKNGTGWSEHVCTNMVTTCS